MKLKKILAQFIPIGIYNYLNSRQPAYSFIPHYKNYLNRTQPCSREIEEEGKKYKSIVSVQGLGYTGSGAVLDLLCEIDSCDVVGTNYNDKGTNDHNGLFECDFLRLSGCFFEIEKYLDSSNIYQNDSLLNRFIDYLNDFSLCRKDQIVQDLFAQFLSNIVEFSIFDVNGVPYNHHLKGKKTSSSIFFLKKMKKEDYRTLCRKFLIKFFNRISTKDNSVIILDQLLSDFEFDYSNYANYIPGVKIILVYRDPRDVYAYAKTHIEQDGWMAHDSVDHFISWYKILTRNIDFQSSDILFVQFEKLVFSYEVEKKRILEYLDINVKEGLARARTMFNPEISKKNIGIWKNSGFPISDFEKIQSELKDYCYSD